MREHSSKLCLRTLALIASFPLSARYSGDSRMPCGFLIISALINIGLNCYSFWPFKWGISCELPSLSTNHRNTMQSRFISSSCVILQYLTAPSLQFVEVAHLNVSHYGLSDASITRYQRLQVRVTIVLALISAGDLLPAQKIDQVVPAFINVLSRDFGGL